MRASPLTVGTAHLDHLDASVVEIAGEPRSIGSCALDPDVFDGPEAAHPGERLSVAGGISGERLTAELRPSLIEHRHHVHVAVGVDPSRDASCCLCHCGHSHPLVGFQPQQGGRTDRDGGQDRDGAYSQAPIRSRPPDRHGPSEPSDSVDRSIPRQPKRQPVFQVAESEDSPDTLIRNLSQVVDEEPFQSSLPK